METYGNTGKIQREIDMMTPLRMVPKESFGKYNPGSVYQDAMAYSRILADSIDNLYSTALVTAEANQFAQDALNTLEAKLGPTGPVKKAPEPSKETIGELVKVVTGEYLIANPKVA